MNVPSPHRLKNAADSRPAGARSEEAAPTRPSKAGPALGASIAASLFVLTVLVPGPVVAARAGTSRRKIRPAATVTIDPDLVEIRGTNPVLRLHSKGAAVVRAAILLDRQWYSPGEIDGGFGERLSGAVSAWQHEHRLPETGSVDAATWASLELDVGPILQSYTVTAEDVGSPFTPIPESVEEKGRLPRLDYESLPELLGERFHSSPKLLAALNHGLTTFAAGDVICVPSIESPSSASDSSRKTVNVLRSRRSVSVTDGSGRIICHFPASLGNVHDPLPLGRLRVNGVRRDPDFHFDPALFWNARAEDAKTLLKPGPNNPVGAVWIDLSKAHYGIHGGPEPGDVGRAQTHGCIRLANWDALRLAGLVKPGTTVEVQP